MFYSKQRRIDELEIKNQMLVEENARLKDKLGISKRWKRPVYKYRTHRGITEKYSTRYICVVAEEAAVDTALKWESMK